MLIEAIKTVAVPGSPEAFVDPIFVRREVVAAVAALETEKTIAARDALLDVIVPDPLPIPLKILESAKK
jgi:hypothetical protein